MLVKSEHVFKKAVSYHRPFFDSFVSVFVSAIKTINVVFKVLTLVMLIS